MISLTTLRIIQNKIVDYKIKNKIDSKKRYWETGLSSSRVAKTLNMWTVNRYPNDYYRFNNLDNSDLKLILYSFNIQIPIKLFRKQELKPIKQTIDFSK